MKIFTSAQMRELDQYTIEHEPIRSIDLMDRETMVAMLWRWHVCFMAKAIR